MKAYLDLHRVYGVDLNATAVELAEISLWLDIMTGDLKAPWFGLHLRRGNSLIGARRDVFTPEQVADKSWVNTVPVTLEFTDDTAEPESLLQGRIFHFLLPGNMWGAASDSSELKSIAPEEQKALKAWRRGLHKKPTAKQIKKLQDLSLRVEALWRLATVRMELAEDQIRRTISVWGHNEETPAKNVTRTEIEQDLLENEDGAFRRLRLVMDAWCALWFWPIDAADEAPDFDEWLNTLEDILGHAITNTVRTQKGNVSTNTPVEEQLRFGRTSSWEDLNGAEDYDWKLADARRISECTSRHPWLEKIQDIANQQAFFHWDLDFAAVMERGGFDLQMGNPPWVRPRSNLDQLLAESDPWFELAHKPTQVRKNTRRSTLLDDDHTYNRVTAGLTESTTTAKFLGSTAEYPELSGQQPDLYRAFMSRTWRNIGAHGSVALIHPESHFVENKAAPLRRSAYLHLRRHWQFVNELSLFDVHHLVKYGIHAYSTKRELPSFLQATSLYHPDTVIDSLTHDGRGPVPGLKDEQGNWDLRPHADRIITVDLEHLELWQRIVEGSEGSPLEARMFYAVSSDASNVAAKLSSRKTLGELPLLFTRGWDESIDRKAGYFEVGWSHPESWKDVILQGPHIGVSTPMIKQPNPTLKHNQDWTEVDLEAIPEDFIPATAYQPIRDDEDSYENDYKTWIIDDVKVNSSEFPRVAWRAMAASTNFRTMFPSLIPPGAKHVNGVFTAADPQSLENTLLFGGSSSTILADFIIRAITSTKLSFSTASTAAIPSGNSITETIRSQFLRLNALTNEYSDVWKSHFGTDWSESSPIRISLLRQRAQSEIDALYALSTGISADELCMIYRTQFPVMYRYDREDRYDKNGRKVPKEIMKEQLAGEKKHGADFELLEDQRRWTHPQSNVDYHFEYPFEVFDREAAMREAYERYRHLVDEE